jgi:hypothetical protein
MLNKLKLKIIRIKWLCFSAILLLNCIFGYQFFDSQFKLKNIQFDFHERASSSFIFLDDSTNFLPILKQHYTYLDRGKQSYVFVSEDGKYILKFFDARSLQPNPFSFSFSSIKSLKRKKKQLFEGYRIAYLKNREHSGILFMRLRADPSLNHHVLLTDRFGLIHQIPLNSVPFIIQIKAVPTRDLITSLLKKNNLSEVKMSLRKIINLYLDEYRRGIYDQDHNFMYNTGFVGNQPIRIDLGRLTEDVAFIQPEIYMHDLKKIALERVDGWMSRHFPQHRQEIIDDMQSKLQEILEEISGS